MFNLAMFPTILEGLIVVGTLPVRLFGGSGWRGAVAAPVGFVGQLIPVLQPQNRNQLSQNVA